MVFNNTNNCGVLRDRLSALKSIVETLLPNEVLFDIAVVDRTVTESEMSAFRKSHPLVKAEYAAIERAVRGREIEYRIGRSLAKNLLIENWKITDGCLYKKANGAPNWPQEIVGSISHSSETCIVVVSDKNSFSGVGVDIEEGGDFSSDIEGLVLNPGEQSKVLQNMQADSVLRAIFCCKEALYKSLELYLIRRINFNDVFINITNTNYPDIFDYSFQFTRTIDLKSPLDMPRFRGRMFADERMAVASAAFVALPVT